jgi:hypothetical protein
MTRSASVVGFGIVAEQEAVIRSHEDDPCVRPGRTQREHGLSASARRARAVNRVQRETEQHAGNKREGAGE